MEAKLLRQVHILQVLVALLFVWITVLAIKMWSPKPQHGLQVLDAQRINIREKDGTIKAVLSSSEGFGERGQQGTPFSGLMFYNQEGEEEGGLVYSGKAIAGGQNADVTLTFDQYRQDQNIYLHHEEHRDANGRSIDDGLTIISRPDWEAVKAEYASYGAIEKLPENQRDALKLKYLQEGKISTRRLFFGVRRGIADKVSYDDAGIFIKNRWGRDAIKLYVDYANKPHLEVYDELGKSIVYDLKVPTQQ